MHIADQSLPALRRCWMVIAFGFGLVFLVGWWLLVRVWSSHTSLWLLMATLPAFYVLGLLGTNLKHNHRQGETQLLPSLGVGNYITLFRGLLFCLIAGFISAPMPQGILGWVPSVFYTAAIILDLLDGYAARRTHHTTRLGEKLDIELDGLGVLAAIILGVRYGHLPWWFLGLAPLRPLFLLGIRWRQRRGLCLFPNHGSSYRRLVAGMQMAFLSVILWPPMRPPVTTLSAVFVASAVVASFGRDWLVATGVFDATSEVYWRRKDRLKRVLVHWLPPVLRLLVTASGVVLVIPALLTYPQPRVELWHWFLIVASALTFFGVATRPSAVFVALTVALHAAATQLGIFHGLMVIGGLYLILSGGGRFVVWEPERRFFTERLGARGEVPGGQNLQ